MTLSQDTSPPPLPIYITIILIIRTYIVSNTKHQRDPYYNAFRFVNIRLHERLILDGDGGGGGHMTGQQNPKSKNQFNSIIMVCTKD